MTTAAAGAPPAAGVPSAKSTDDDEDGSPPSVKDGADDPISAAEDDAEPVPMSLDRDASDRSFDRQLAHLGLLDDAAPLFLQFAPGQQYCVRRKLCGARFGGTRPDPAT